MINNRQAGRRRGRGGNNGGNNGPRQGGGQRDTGNRIDSRARGNANQLYEKYKNLAADAQRQGDRVNTEYYLQFADHYFRVLSETRSRFEEQNQRREAQPFTGSFDTGFDSQDDDFADEGEPIRPGEQQGYAEDRGSDRDGNRSEDRGQRHANGQQPRRDDRPRDDRQRDDRPRGEQRQDGERPQRDQFARDGERAPTEAGEAPQRRPRRYREEPALTDGQVGEPASVPEAIAAPEASAPEAEAPRRRGRPRRERPADEAPAAFDATLLPPSIAPAPASAAADKAAPMDEKPRRRRTRVTPVEATPAE